MNNYEKELRERFDIDNLLTLKIGSVKQGHRLIEKINDCMSEGINEMRHSNLNNAQSDCWNNLLYDMKTARNKIQSQMNSLVKKQMDSLLRIASSL